MKNYAKGGLTRLIGKVFFLGCVLLSGGCAQLINSPPDPAEPGDGRVLIFIGAGPERTAFPRLDQLSKIVLSFKRQGGTDTMPPVELGLGETVVVLNPGTWELTASAYNKANPPVVAASAANTLTRNGELITGNTYFALAPAGTGQGTLSYKITPPGGVVLDPARSRIQIEKDGEALETLPISGALTGTASLASGSYTVNIVLDDNSSANSAAFQEAALILPGLTTEIVFAPQAGDFLNPELRAVLSNVDNVKFGRTQNNSSRTVIGESGGGELNKTQALSVPHGMETAHFTLTGLRNLAMTIGGANAGSVRYATSGTVDGYAAKPAEAVFTVDIPSDLADAGGAWDFTLALGEPGKTPVVYTVSINLPFLERLGVVWPSKWVYRVGEAFDPAGLELFGFYTDGTRTPISGGYALEGFDTSTVGERNVRITKYGITGYEIQDKSTYKLSDKDSFLLTVVSGARLVFDPELEAEHNALIGNSQVNLKPPPTGYTVSPGRTVVLAPIKFLIPDNAVYEWKVDNAAQVSATTEYLSFAYNAFGPGSHTVTVTAKVNGSPVAAATTTVSCVSGAVKRPTEEASNAAAEKLFSVVAPGQFGSGSARLGNYHGFGGFGGYAVFKFDHSVPKDGVDGKELKIGGNTGVWTEPGAVWVSMDENNNGEPDDTWYELKGSHTLNTPNTLRRYAVTFRNDYTWTDNLGGGGTYPRLQGYAAYSDHLGQGFLTLVGTRLHDSLVGKVGVWGYADVWDDQTNSLSNAIQVDGTPVDLPFVDFVKIVTAVHYADPELGERSTEAGTPKDMKMNDPEMMMEGSNDGAGLYHYYFKNDSGYDLTISFEGEEFTLSKKGIQATEVRKTSSKAVVYIDYRGGNVTLIKQGETALFVNGPEE
jgi:hypothetical protein